MTNTAPYTHIRNMSEESYSKTTNDIKVSVIPTYLADQSEPSDDVYVWAYTVQVENLSDHKVKLLNRHWKISDAMGQLQEVQGVGVVGEQPELNPGEGFRYTSGTMLKTPSGLMFGAYEMEADTGETFPVDIPGFSLDSPYQVSRPN